MTEHYAGSDTMTTAPARRPESIGPYCISGDMFGPKVHARCHGNGPLYLPGTPKTCAPVLPAENCGCPCYGKGPAQPTTIAIPRAAITRGATSENHPAKR